MRKIARAKRQMKKKRRTVVPAQVDKMRAELASLNHCAVLSVSRAAVNLCWYYTSETHPY